MKRGFVSIALLLMLAITAAAQGKAKYVFYFIGDGMGVNQVNAAETYLAAIEGRIGIKEMCFPSFPYVALVNTQSAVNGVTDSAAGGTALATGHKTKNGALGVMKDLTTPVTSIADWAREAGAAVGITTSVSVDHATPAAFYAHVGSRGEAYSIGRQLVESDNDFYAGSDFLNPDNPDQSGKDLYSQAKDRGFTIARGYKDYRKKAGNADRMILLQSEEASKKDRHSIPYAIDRGKNDLSLSDITRAAINFLTRKQSEKNGFFLMVEGGKIDWACHANDLAFIPEVIDMDNAVKVAYEFYQQHPDETLIVVTADHETGGLVLGRNKYQLHLDVAGYQRVSTDKLGKDLHLMHEKYGDKYSWDVVENYLADNFGFWNQVKLSDAQTERLKNAFEKIRNGKGETTKTLYQMDDELAVTVKDIQQECALVSWAVTGHSNGYVPCFAIGAGAEMFQGRIDNTEICKRIAKSAGWQ